MKTLLEIDSLQLRFGELTVIDDLSLSLADGELLAIVGPNGAGKTALLNCINGIYHPQSGSLIFDGSDVSRTGLRDMVAVGISRAFQHMELFGHLTVLENILLGRHSRMHAGILSNLFYLRTHPTAAALRA